MISPLGALVLIKEIVEEEQTSSSGLFIVNNSTITDLKSGEIVAVGAGDRDSHGDNHPIPLEVGDIVLYLEHQATEVTDEGVKYQFVNWNNLFGKKH